ncbi:MAG: hypothetical protein Ct9H90mP27_1770 [Gammaproteobacteria bacterium]|nr:MAG: hypothetical protein Ct9H90mP27_1770 [Gammaproteobacteria bacterium]
MIIGGRKILSSISYTFFPDPGGPDLIIYGTESCLMGVGFLRARDWTKERETWVEQPEAFREIMGQLKGYFSGTLKLLKCLYLCPVRNFSRAFIGSL